MISPSVKIPVVFNFLLRATKTPRFLRLIIDHNFIISILGSTGSVGLNALSIIDKRKKLFKFNLLSANKNYSLICKQIAKYNPSIFVINDKKIFTKIKNKFKKKKIRIFNNYDDLKLKKISHITISAIPGIAGLKPTITMI